MSTSGVHGDNSLNRSNEYMNSSIDGKEPESALDHIRPAKLLTAEAATERWNTLEIEKKIALTPSHTLRQCEDALHVNITYLFKAKCDNEKKRNEAESMTLRTAANEAISFVSSLCELIDPKSGALPSLTALLSSQVLPGLISSLSSDVDIESLGCTPLFCEYLASKVWPALKASESAFDVEDDPDVILADTSVQGSVYASNRKFESMLENDVEENAALEQAAVTSALSGLVLISIKALIFALSECSLSHAEALNPLVALASVAAKFTELLPRPALAVEILLNAADAISNRQAHLGSSSIKLKVTRESSLIAMLRINAGICGLRACSKLKAREAYFAKNAGNALDSLKRLSMNLLKQDVCVFGGIEKAVELVETNAKLTLKGVKDCIETQNPYESDIKEDGNKLEPTTILLRALPEGARLLVDLQRFHEASKLFSMLADATLVEHKRLVKASPNSTDAQKVQLWVNIHRALLDEAKCHMNAQSPHLAVDTLKKSEELYASKEFKSSWEFGSSDRRSNEAISKAQTLALQIRLTSLNICGTAYAMLQQHAKALTHWEQCATLARQHMVPVDPNLLHNISTSRQMIEKQ